ncbi:MAG: site-specific integrase [Ferruginibacter sp.]
MKVACFGACDTHQGEGLRPDHIQHNDDDSLWIRMERKKTEISFMVPLLRPALELLNKYLGDKSTAFVFPVLSNQKMNDNLKIIQEITGISKNLTTHLARHSFATTITLNNDVPIETVSRMMGHTNLRTTQLYAKVLDAKIGSDMKKLQDKLK